jgi:hypothetical protein
MHDARTEKVADNATFAGLSNNGAYLFYVLAGNAYRFSTSTEETTQVTSTGDAELVNVSADGSHVYCISRNMIAGQGIVGQPNLYVWDAATGESAFIATVIASDLEGRPALNNWTSNVVSPEVNRITAGPGYSSSRTTPDGSVIAFESAAKLTAYENGGHREIYRYASRDHSLLCVSCNPDGEPPTFDARFEVVYEGHISTQVIVHNLSDDGNRVFFETEEALVGRDVDVNNDIYEWSAGAEPALSLITSGQTAVYREPSFPEGLESLMPTNEIAAVTPSGSDVFFRTSDSLTPTAGVNGTPAIYDARIGGGFAASAGSVCEGDGCQGEPSGAPVFASTVSAVFAGAGNIAVHGKPVRVSKSLTRAQRFARALKACERQPKRKHRQCQAQARRRYGARKAVKSTSGRAAR